MNDVFTANVKDTTVINVIQQCPWDTEGNMSVLSSCLRWLRGQCQQFILKKRAVHVRTFKDQVTSKILDSQVINNSRCLRVGLPPSKSEPSPRHSFFARTIIDWNHLEHDIVDAPSSEAFLERLANSHSCALSPAALIEAYQYCSCSVFLQIQIHKIASRNVVNPNYFWRDIPNTLIRAIRHCTTGPLFKSRLRLWHITTTQLWSNCLETTYSALLRRSYRPMK